MDPLTNLHGMVVHFPIALLFVSVGLELLALAPKWRGSLQPAALVTLLVGALGAFFSVVTGPEDNARGVTQLMHTHESWAKISMLIFGALAIWRLILAWRKKTVTGPAVAIYLVAAAIGLGSLGYVGYLGGKMVYEEAVGVQRNGVLVAPPTQRFQRQPAQ